MKLYTTVFIFLLTISCFSQIENNTNSVQFEIEEKDTSDPTGFELPARKLPSLTIPKEERDPKTNFTLGEDTTPAFSMNTDDGLLDNKTNNAPKAFTKDKEPLPKYGKDQFLGDVKTKAKYVQVKYRDHEYVDGDQIRVFVNDDVVQSSVWLGGAFKGFTLTLQEGFNSIVFVALNQGTSGPNTAELHVYDEKGMIISAKEWNLLTGNKATIVVIKE